MTSNPPVYFYNPERVWYEGKDPEKVDNYGNMFQHGHLTWIVQTYMRLKNIGFNCLLTDYLPDEGIIIAHGEHLPLKLKPNKNQLFVYTKADRGRQLFSQINIVQNPDDPIVNSVFGKWNAYFIPHWPQVGLIPRNKERCDTIENISYYGQEAWLDPFLKSDEFHEGLNKLGVNFRIMPPDKWNDYSDTDLVLAIRSFDSHCYYDKPATKLYNAWIAGSPAILGVESAYRAVRNSSLDYIEVSSKEMLLNEINFILKNKQKYLDMIDNGLNKARSLSYDSIACKWKETLIASYNHYYQWKCLSDKKRALFFLTRMVSNSLLKFKSKISHN